ncbi:hypothetical protein [Pseudomonas zeae]|uniref:Uncharacterized protein n=1 Tax=Pseudomonas zeae TaxID=2745510 RepID=A0A9E6TBL6_9PSED|nr:hypothetical protein [Pseudomonas zeae]QXI12202.1 hypothetical protein HU754_001935 [Pseudomonas zeae]
MTDARQTPEDSVIKHVREQHNAEPPAHLDAFILNAAQRQTPAPKPSLWQRWADLCRKPRWQVAFASLVGVALMLSLVQRAPEPDYAPAPKLAVPMTDTDSAQLHRLSAPAGAMPAPAPMMEMAAPMQDQTISAGEAKLSKRAATPANGLDAQLREVLRLRESGQSQAADSLFNNLHKRYPNADLDARLQQLQKK